MPNEARTHSDARTTVCSVCWKKSGKGATIVSKEMEVLIRKHVFKDYSVTNESYPASLCGSCRVCIKEIEKVCPISQI